MKVLCEAAGLKQAAKVTAKGINKRTNMPILTGVKLTTGGDYVALESTDLDVWTRAIVPAALEDDGYRGEIVAGAAFADLIKAVKGEIMLSINGKLIVNGATVEPLPLEDYPTRPTIARRIPLLKMNGKDWKAFIKRFAVCTRGGNDTNRLSLTGVYFNAADGLTVAATDGYRLLRETFPYSGKPVEILVKAADLKRFAPSIPAKATVTVEVGFEADDWKFLILAWEGAEILFKAIPEEFPDIDRVIPTVTYPNATEITLNRAEFLEVLNQATPFTDPESDAVRLAAGSDAVIISADNKIGEFEDIINAAIRPGQCTAIAFKRRYLADYLANSTAETVTLIITDPEKAGRILPDDNPDQVYIIMPVRTDY